MYLVMSYRVSHDAATKPDLRERRRRGGVHPRAGRPPVPHGAHARRRAGARRDRRRRRSARRPRRPRRLLRGGKPVSANEMLIALAADWEVSLFSDDGEWICE